MLLQPAIPRRHSLPVPGTSVSPLPQTAGKPFPISTDPILPRPRVQAWTKLRRKSPPRRQGAVIQPSRPIVTAAAATPSISATRAIKVKLRRKSPPRQGAIIQPLPPTVTAAAAAPSVSATQAIKVTVPSTRSRRRRKRQTATRISGRSI